jgi:outer membrane murein-binding lipoprotein Lpp
MNTSSPLHFLFTAILAFTLLGGCKTRSEIRREQEMEKIKQDVTSVKGQKADVEQTVEELRTEVARLATVFEEQNSQLRTKDDDQKK